jgi:hypothetical protein
MAFDDLDEGNKYLTFDGIIALLDYSHTIGSLTWRLKLS